MGWDKRKNGKKYYYHGKKVGKTVHKTYLGRGPAAVVMSLRLEQARAQLACDLEKLALAEARWAPLEKRIARLHAACTLLSAATLYLAGYHQHHRGQWRSRRELKRQAAAG